MHPAVRLTLEPLAAISFVGSAPAASSAILFAGCSPRFTHQKVGVGALAGRIFLNPSISYGCGIEIAIRIGDEAVYAPHATLASPKRPPGIEEMTVFVISIQLVRSLIRCPKNMVLPHVKGMNIHRRPRAHIPLVEELSIFVELLNAPVVAIVDENEVTFRINGNSVNVIEIPWARFVGLAALLAPLEELLAILVKLNDTGAVIAVAQVETAIRLKGHKSWAGEMRIVVARDAWRSQRKKALRAVVREFADEMVIGIHDPDMLFGIVGADLNVVGPSPDFVPL